MNPYLAVREVRGVRNPCPVCVGMGVTHYANGATWRGGAGGSAVTLDVCSRCWGTGDRDRTGVNLRDLTERLAKAEGFLRRVVKYAREDRAATPGFTRLARLVAAIDAWMTRGEDAHG